MLLIEPLGIAWRPIPKCGTCSTFRLLYNHLSDDEIQKNSLCDWRQEARIRDTVKRSYKCDNSRAATDEEYKKMLSSDVFVFALIRNPWSRLVAGYLQAMRWYSPSLTKDDKDAIEYNQKDSKGLKTCEIYSLMKENLSFDSFVNFVIDIEGDETDFVNYHWKPQHEILRPDIFTYDFLGKIEEWTYSWETVRANSKINFTETPNLNRHPKYDYRDFYTSTKQIDIVGEHYSNDLELFKNYTFGD